MRGIPSIIETDGLLHPDDCASSKEQTVAEELAHIEAPPARVSHAFVPTGICFEPFIAVASSTSLYLVSTASRGWIHSTFMIRPI